MKTNKEYNIFSLIEYYPKIGKVTIARLRTCVEVAGKKMEVCGTGKSKCCPQDKYDRGFGVALAYTRAVIQLNKKLEKLLLKETFKTEWRKEESVEYAIKILEIKVGLQTYSASTQTETDSSKELETVSVGIEKLQSLISNNEKRLAIENRLSELEKLISDKIRTIKDIESRMERLHAQQKELKMAERDVDIESFRTRITGAKAVIKDKMIAIENVANDTDKGFSPMKDRAYLLRIIVPLFSIIFAAFLSWVVGYPYVFLPIGLALVVVTPLLISRFLVKDSNLNAKVKELSLQELRQSVKEKEDEIDKVLKKAGVSSEQELLELDVKIKTIKERIRENEGVLSALAKGKKLDEIKDEETVFLKEKKELVLDLTDELRASFIDPKDIFIKKQELESLQSTKAVLVESIAMAKAEVKVSKYSYDDLTIAEEKLANTIQELDYNEERAKTY